MQRSLIVRRLVEAFLGISLLSSCGFLDVPGKKIVNDEDSQVRRVSMGNVLKPTANRPEKETKVQKPNDNIKRADVGNELKPVEKKDIEQEDKVQKPNGGIRRVSMGDVLKPIAEKDRFQQKSKIQEAKQKNKVEEITVPKAKLQKNKIQKINNIKNTVIADNARAIEKQSRPQNSIVPELVKKLNHSVNPAYQTEAVVFKNPLLAIIQSALDYNRSQSALPATIAQRQFKEAAVRKEKYPDIRPVANISDKGKTFAGVSGSYTLYDFGRHDALQNQSELSTQLSQLDFGLEQRTVMADVLKSVGEISALREKAKLISRVIEKHQRLISYASKRLEAGLITESDSLAVKLRVSELLSQVESIRIEIHLKLKLLSNKLKQPITIKDIPSLQEINQLAQGLDMQGKAIHLRQEQLNVKNAKAKLEQAKAERYPQIALQGKAGFKQDGEYQYNVGINISVPTSVFSGGDTVSAAESAYMAAQKILNKAETKIETEFERIGLEKRRLMQNQSRLKQLVGESKKSLALYMEKLKLSKASVSDVLSASRILLQSQIEIVKINQELVVLTATLIKITDKADSPLQ